MEKKQIYSYVEHSYQKIQNRWLSFHLCLLPVCTVFLFIIEIIMFFVVKETNALLHTHLEYFLLYILFPISMCACMSIVSYLLVKKTSIPIKKKQYIISYMFMSIAFVMSWVHGGFIVALLTVLFPIVFTVIYEDIHLTSSMTVFAIVIEIFTAFSTTFDFDKVINAYYIINLVMIVLMTLFTWGICYAMIRFMQMKKEIIIQNDIRRYELQDQVMVDGLTKVGSRIGLDYFMKEISDYSDDEYCLVMLDIDRFKDINDVYGHIKGDQVLKELGSLLMSQISQAKIYRYGGDEFVLIFINHKYQDIEKIMYEFFKLVEIKLHITLSAGASVARRNELHQMMYYADNALYKSKAVKGSRISLYQGK